jgi:integrase/recombinase XerD
MGLKKQAKILNKAQVDAALNFVAATRARRRNKVILLLSVRAGLRAKEIANLTWEMITDAQGKVSNSLHLIDAASKGNSGRIVPLSKDLRQALGELQEAARSYPRSPYVVATERLPRTSPAVIVNLFAYWYRSLGFAGASSHSGRRTAITNWARKISTVGGSLRDVQILAGHSALTTTQRYIEAHADAQRRVVEL